MRRAFGRRPSRAPLPVGALIAHPLVNHLEIDQPTAAAHVQKHMRSRDVSATALYKGAPVLCLRNRLSGVSIFSSSKRHPGGGTVITGLRGYMDTGAGFKEKYRNASPEMVQAYVQRCFERDFSVMGTTLTDLSVNMHELEDGTSHGVNTIVVPTGTLQTPMRVPCDVDPTVMYEFIAPPHEDPYTTITDVPGKVMIPHLRPVSSPIALERSLSNLMNLLTLRTNAAKGGNVPAIEEEMFPDVAAFLGTLKVLDEVRGYIDDTDFTWRVDVTDGHGRVKPDIKKTLTKFAEGLRALCAPPSILFRPSQAARAGDLIVGEIIHTPY